MATRIWEAVQRLVGFTVLVGFGLLVLFSGQPFPLNLPAYVCVLTAILHLPFYQKNFGKKTVYDIANRTLQSVLQAPRKSIIQINDPLLI